MQTTGVLVRPKAFSSPRVVFAAVLGVLLVIDALFVGIHVVQGRLSRDPSYEGFFANHSAWSLGIDGSFSELYMYAKAGVAAIVMFALYSKQRMLTYLGWGLVFLFVMLDDSLGIHEAFSVFMVNNVSLPTVLNVEPYHYAAFILWAVAGLVLIGFIGWGGATSVSQPPGSSHAGFFCCSACSFSVRA